MRKEVVVAYFEVLFWCLSKDNEEITKDFSQDSQYPGQDSNQVLLNAYQIDSHWAKCTEIGTHKCKRGPYLLSDYFVTLCNITVFTLLFTFLLGHIKAANMSIRIYMTVFSYRFKMVHLLFTNNKSVISANIHQYSFAWHNDWWIINCKILARNLLWPSRVTIREFFWSDWGKLRQY
jgi:hypothetical protein